MDFKVEFQRLGLSGSMRRPLQRLTSRTARRESSSLAHSLSQQSIFTTDLRKTRDQVLSILGPDDRTRSDCKVLQISAGNCSEEIEIADSRDARVSVACLRQTLELQVPGQVQLQKS